MKRYLRHLCFLAFLAATIYSAQGVPYFYFTEYETIPFGSAVPFLSGDTLWGPFRSNDTITINGSPVFLNLVITCAAVFEQGGYYNPVFLGPDPHFNAPPLIYTGFSAWIREHATSQGHFYANGADAKALIHFGDHSLRVFWGTQEMPFDTSEFTDVNLPDSAVVFFDCPVQISGIVHSIIIFGAAGDIGLEDNIVYSGTDTLTGYTGYNEAEKLTLVSEGNITILNTWANGRDNKAQGRDIIINALIVTLDSDSGHFTFDEQNDPGDSLIGPIPDERGTIYLTGAIYQKYRDYLHRSNNSGTGYVKSYRFDYRLLYWDLPIFVNPEIDSITESLDFDTVSVGESATDSITIELQRPALIDLRYSLMISPIEPFSIEWYPDPYDFDSTMTVPITFSPTAAGMFEYEFPVYIEGNRFNIPIRGVAVIPNDASENFSPHPSSFILSCYPNPFNPTTTIQFDLPIASPVELDVYNLAGQKVQSLAEQPYSAGSHTLAFDGSGLPSGLYFARLQAGANLKTIKLLLMK